MATVYAEHWNISSGIIGRPTDSGMLYWFQRLCQWLETEADAELYTLMELHAKMSELADGAEVYTPNTGVSIPMRMCAFRHAPQITSCL